LNHDQYEFFTWCNTPEEVIEVINGVRDDIINGK
jgi:hypothetical protein